MIFIKRKLFYILITAIFAVFLFLPEKSFADYSVVYQENFNNIGGILNGQDTWYGENNYACGGGYCQGNSLGDAGIFPIARNFPAISKGKITFRMKTLYIATGQRGFSFEKVDGDNNPLGGSAGIYFESQYGEPTGIWARAWDNSLGSGILIYPDYLSDTWYNFTIEFEPNQYKVKIDDNAFSGWITAFGETDFINNLTFHIVYLLTGGELSFDDIVVSEYFEPPPPPPPPPLSYGSIIGSGLGTTTFSSIIGTAIIYMEYALWWILKIAVVIALIYTGYRLFNKFAISTRISQYKEKRKFKKWGKKRHPEIF